jgi:hypothetical protein
MDLEMACRMGLTMDPLVSMKLDMVDQNQRMFLLSNMEQEMVRQVLTYVLMTHM